jgi:hypothetical protein
MRVCLSTAVTALYPQGGHLWVFLNWAYGLQRCGCDVTWLDVVPEDANLLALHQQLQALVPFKVVLDYLSDTKIAASHDYDFLLDLRYNTPQRILRSAGRCALLDIDPGQLQQAITGGAYPAPTHDVLLSIGYVQGWIHCPPCVALEEWPVKHSPSGPWTTVAHWWNGDYDDSKRVAFEPYMDICRLTGDTFNLALNLESPEEQRRIESFGFRVLDAHAVASSPDAYRRFIQSSVGEFSPAKRSYVRRQTGWISDRTLCYLASGKPCVVEDTGGALPSGSGLHRFHDLIEAVDAVRYARANYADECRAARAYAETHFDAVRVCRRLLDMSL